MSEFKTVNPATGETLKSFSHLAKADVDKALKKAREAYLSAKTKSVADRSSDLKAIAKGLRARKSDLARIMTLEMGKPLKDSLAEVEKSAGTFEFFGEALPEMLKREEVKTTYVRSSIVKDSIGPILAVMPWNFPLWQVTRFAAPAVGIGNPILLKHSDLTAGTAALIGEIFDEVRDGLLFNLRIDHDQAAEAIGDRRCAAVTLTGSAKAGREIAQTAGHHLKKTVLELGGSDAYVVLKDADVEKAAQICADGRMVNNGQSCVAAKRFIVHDSVVETFTKLFEARVRELKMGDPLNEKTSVGSLASKKFQEGLLKQCADIEKAGAKKVFDVDEKFDFKAAGAFFPARGYRVTGAIESAFTESKEASP